MIYTKSLDTQQLSINDENRARRIKSRKPCLRILMMIINFLFMVGGIGLLAAGIYALLTPSFLSAMLGSQLLRVLAILFIIAGSAVLLFSILGCCGAYLENKCLLGLYLLLIFIVFITIIVCLIVLATKQEAVRNTAKKYIEYELQMRYGYNSSFTDLVDRVQIKLRCCGVITRNKKYYEKTKWYHGQPKNTRISLPGSCCIKSRAGVYDNKSKCQRPKKEWTDEHSRYYYKEGCLDALWDLWCKYRRYIVASGVVVLIILVLLFLTTLVFMCQIGKRRYHTRHTMDM